MAARFSRSRWRKGTPTGAVNKFRTDDTPQILSYHSKLVRVNYRETLRSNWRSCLLAFEICHPDTEYVELHHTTVQIVIKGIRWSVNEIQRVGGGTKARPIRDMFAFAHWVPFIFDVLPQLSCGDTCQRWTWHLTVNPCFEDTVNGKKLSTEETGSVTPSLERHFARSQWTSYNLVNR